MKKEYRDARPGEVAAYISSHAAWFTRYGNEIRFRPSPCCNANNHQNPSCQVEDQKGMWRCFSCGVVGNWFTLTRAFGDPLADGDRYRDGIFRYSADWGQLFTKQTRRPVTSGHYPQLLDYALARGIDRETLNLWLVTTKGPNNLRWPIFLWNNNKWEMVNARIRACTGDGKIRDWYEIRGGPTDLLIGNHLLKLNGSKRAIITEGQWDAMTLTQLGFDNVFSLPNGSTNIRVAEMLRYIPDAWEVWLAMDGDRAGDRAIEKFFAQLGPERVARIQLPVKDANQMLIENPDLTKTDIENCIVGLTKQTMVSKKNNDWLALDMNSDDDDGKSEIIINTPFPELTRILAGGFRASQTTGILAPSGRGKTTLVNQLGIFAANNGVRTGLISLEGGRKALKRKLQDCVRGTCKRETWLKTVNKITVSRLEGSKVTWTQCIEELKSMAEHGCKLLIIDNLDHIMRDSNSSDKSNAYAEIIEMSRLTDTHSIVVWQPNKVNRDKIVNSGNQKGYSQALQDADNYLNLNRIRDYNLIEVEKSREEGVHGDGKVWLVYDLGMRAFVPCAQAPHVNLGNQGHVVPLRALEK